MRFLATIIFMGLAQVPFVYMDKTGKLDDILYGNLWFPFTYIAGIFVAGIVFAYYLTAQKAQQVEREDVSLD